MTPTPHLPLVAVLVIGAFAAWRVTRRIRRLVGRQPFREWRSWSSAVLFPLVVVGSLVVASGDPLRLAIALASAGVGLGLGVYGLRRTAFERSPSGSFYTPSLHIGVALSLLLTARVIYRFAQIYFAGDDVDPESMNVGRSPLTLAIVATFAAYYATYAIGLIRRFRFISTQDPPT